MRAVLTGLLVTQILSHNQKIRQGGDTKAVWFGDCMKLIVME